MKNILIKDKDGKFKVVQNGSLSLPTQSPVFVSLSNSNELNKNIENKNIQQNTQIKNNSYFNEDSFELKDEIKSFENISQRTMQNELTKYMQEISKNIVSQIGVDTLSQNKKDNLIALLTTVLRGVRNIQDTKDILLRQETNGGFGLNNEQVNNITEQIQKSFDILTQKRAMLQSFVSSSTQNKQITQDQKNAVIDKLRKTYAGNEDYNLKELIGKNNLPLNKSVVEPQKQEPSPIPIYDETKKEVIQKSNDGKTKLTHNPTIKLNPPSNPILIKTKSTGVSMVDILPANKALKGESFENKNTTIDTRPNRLVGPIDELGLMNLIDFRRMDTDVLRSVNKLAEKLKLLEERSYMDKIKGVQAWRSSELYNLYVKIGFESLSTTKSVEQVIKQITDLGQDTLTVEEFNAINQLNKEMTF